MVASSLAVVVVFEGEGRGSVGGTGMLDLCWDVLIGGKHGGAPNRSSIEVMLGLLAVDRRVLKELRRCCGGRLPMGGGGMNELVFVSIVEMSLFGLLLPGGGLLLSIDVLLEPPRGGGGTFGVDMMRVARSINRTKLQLGTDRFRLFHAAFGEITGSLFVHIVCCCCYIITWYAGNQLKRLDIDLVSRTEDPAQSRPPYSIAIFMMLQ